MAYLIAVLATAGLVFIEFRLRILRGQPRVVWTETQRARLLNQYARIGGKPGEPWATPARTLSPDEFLALLERVPAGAGHDGYMAELSRTRTR